MIGLIIAIHITICILLIGIILVQAGRGGGLVEGFSGVESMFGTKTNAFLTRATTILAILFFLTCLSLALLSVRQSKSLIKDTKPQAVDSKSKPAEANQDTAPDTQGLSPLAQPNTQEPVKAE